MSYPRSYPSNIRASSIGNAQRSVGHASALEARINEKRAELENLKQLRDLSAGLASQMQQLEEKLSTLSNGTEAVAAVLSNWHNVLRAINMASMKIPRPKADAEDGVHTEKQDESEYPLPQTLVRIPAEQATAPENIS